MTELIKELCNLDGTSGSEKTVRDYIISKIDGFCDWKIDPLGNILVEKKGKQPSEVRVMFDAHTDEVGFIVTKVCENGFLSFKTVGGIETSALMFRRVKINGLNGVIGGKPIHLLKGDAAKTLPESGSLYIDIGATSFMEASNFVSPGDTGVICGDFCENNDLYLSKALDDRVGCAVLIELIRNESEYDFCASFSVQEEIGCRGCRAAAFTLNPEIAFCLEGTTAADVSGVPEERTVCKVGSGVAVSFMDGGCMYDRELFETAKQSGLPVQVKCAATGGNDSAGIHLSRGGVRTLALSVPCRYIHSCSSVCSKKDCESMLLLSKYMLKAVNQGL